MEKTDSFLEIVQAYLNSNKAVLPVFNQTGMRVQQEVSKEDPDVRTIETLISSDQALTTQVLRTANSAFFKGLSKVNSIREAIVRLGTNEVGNIVSLCTQQVNYQSLQGWQLSQRWNLPDTYGHVIRTHHDPELNTGDTLLILVRLANKACNKMGVGLKPDPEISLETTPEANLLGLNGIFLARLEIQMEDSLVFSRQE